MFAQILADPIVVAEADPRAAQFDGAVGSLFPLEAATISRAVPKRQREFAVGRLLARSALERLGVGPLAIPARTDRSPEWPQGIAGSISHSRTWSAAAVANSERVVALGIDVEEDEPLESRLVDRVCLPSEREWLASLPADERGVFAKIVFSAKEATYKAQFPWTGRVLEFESVAIRIDAERATWRATFEDGERPPGCPWCSVTGRWSRRNGRIATAVAAFASDCLADEQLE